MHRERWQANYQAVIQTAIIAALVILIPSWSVAADTSKDPEINNQNFMITTVTELPDWEPRIDETFTLNQVVTYRDGEENIDENYIVDECKSCGPAYTAFCNPQSEENCSSSFSDLPATSEILTPPINWPHSTTVRIKTTWPSGTTSCSGSLIQPGYVLTAGHCVYTHQAALCDDATSCWLEDMKISNQYYMDASSREVTGYEEILSFTPWTENRDFNFDLAAIKLTTPLGDESNGIGWLGIGHQNNIYFEDKLFMYTSFHASEGTETDLHHWQGELQSLDVHQLYIEMQAVDGQGGAGLVESGGNHILFGVLSHQSEDSSQTGVTRLTNGKFTAIRDWFGIESKDFIDYYYFFPLMVR